VLREGKRSGDFLVNLVTNRFAPGGPEDAVVRAVAEAVAGGVPGVSGVVASLTGSRASAAYGEEERLVLGRATIREKLGGIAFEVSAGSFFQTNTLQAERLVEQLVRKAGLTGREVVYDLYCGAGAISLLAAGHAGLVVGIEGGEAAIADANRTAANNGITNCRFLVGDLRDALRAPAVASFPKPDVVILDPPRAGAHPRALADIARLAPARILYVSCNPATLARDLVSLTGAGYRVESVLPFDMFPHTPHIEVLSVLER
jgi:23S rRNA (uracil1939-C5)-methyltransferase